MQEAPYAGDYTVHLLLGQGGQANVYLGSKNNNLYALKIYHPGSSKEQAFKIQTDFLQKLSFPNLINIVDAKINANIKLPNKPQQTRPLIVLQLAQGGQLFDYLSKLGKFTPQVCRTYTKQIVAAIKYLATVGVSHRDLKPENILFDSSFQLKVSDFGLSRDAQGDYKDYKLTSRVGTEGYKPPEMELGNYTGLQADIFATGVVLFIMYNGTPPFLSTKPHDRIYKLIKEKNFQKFWALHEKNKPPGHFPDSYKRLMNSFFSAEVDKRPSFESLENDEWMKGDDLMGNDLYTYMKAKADKLLQKDENKQKIIAIRKELYLKKTIQEQCCGEDRGDQDQQILTQEGIFAKNYKASDIKIEELPKYTKKKVVYTKQNPAFVVAWLKDHLATLFKEKETFMHNFVGDIVPKNFNLSKEEQNKVKITLEFTIDEQDQTELQLVGKIHRSDKEQIGIQWERVKGHDYWLTAVENSFNGAMQALD